MLGNWFVDSKMLLMLNVGPSKEIDDWDWAIVIVNDLNLVTELILNCFDPVRMDHTWGNRGIVRTIWDKTKLNRFLIALRIFNPGVANIYWSRIRSIIWRVCCHRGSSTIVGRTTENVGHGQRYALTKRTRITRRTQYGLPNSLRIILWHTLSTSTTTSRVRW